MTNENNLETLNLIWLDASLNEDEESRAAQKEFRQIVHQFRPFINENECENFIEKSTKNDRIALIVSGSIGLTLIPKIHKLRQIFAVYIYCMNKKRYEDWSKPYPKVKAILTDFESLIEQIRNDMKKRVENKIDEPLIISRSESTKMNVDFIYFQLLIDSLLQMKANVDEKSQFVRFVEKIYKENANEMKIVKEFDQTYQSRRSIWWWTRDTFLSRLFTKAIRTENFDVLVSMRFFLRDLQNEIETHRCSNSVRLYRTQILSIDELDQLKSSIGSFISIPTFFTANLDRNVAMNFIENYSFRNGEEKILFEIETESSKSFASLATTSYQMNDKEFLFRCGTIFRLKSIEREQTAFSIVRLTLSDENDEDFPQISQFDSFGNFLYQIRKFDLADKFYRQLAKNLPSDDENERLRCFHALGIIALAKEDYQTSVQYHEQSLKLLAPDDPRAAETFNCLACVHQKRGDFPRALEFYEKATQIWTKKFGDDYFQLADSLNNIGCIYESQGHFSNAFEFHQKALKIREKNSSVDQRELGASYNNLGNVYLSMDDFDNALKFYRTALDMKMTNSTSEQISTASTLANLGFVFEKKRIFDQAWIHYQKAMMILRANFPSNHFQIQQIDEDIRRIAQFLPSAHNQTLV